MSHAVHKITHGISHAFHKVSHGVEHIFHEVGHGVEHVFHEIKKHPSLLLAPVAGLGVASAAGVSLPGVLGSVGSEVESIGSAVLKPAGSLLGLTEGASASSLFSSSTLGTVEKAAKIGSLIGMFAMHTHVPEPPSAPSYFKNVNLNFKPPAVPSSSANLAPPDPFKFLNLKKPEFIGAGKISLDENKTKCGTLLRCG